MKKLFLYYSFILVNIMVLMGFANANSFPELISTVLFLPLSIFFWLSVLPHKKKALVIPTSDDFANLASKKVHGKIPGKTSQKTASEGTATTNLQKDGEEMVITDRATGKRKFDLDRRAFVKLIGSAGVTVFMFSIFTKRAQGAFFGSVPGPGIVGVKDSTGTQIDPAREHPTSGYRLAQLDDSTPAYYGFTNADAAWFIIREESSGNFRYTNGSSDFGNVTTGWPNRTNLSYDYYDNVF